MLCADVRDVSGLRELLGTRYIVFIEYISIQFFKILILQTMSYFANDVKYSMSLSESSKPYTSRFSLA